VLTRDPYHALALRALIEAYKGDPSNGAKVNDYLARLQRLAKSKPAPARPVKGG
jgi:hypothetical protein